MKKLFLILFLVFGFLASFAEAEVVKDYTLEQIVQVKNAPTKNIVEQELGAEVIQYRWLPGNEFLEIPGEYRSIKGKIVEKGIEQDSDGRDYNYVIVYFKNWDTQQGNFIKFCQYKWRKRSIFAISGVSTVDLPAVHFRVTDKTWTKVLPFNKYGGYGKDRLTHYAVP